MELEPGFYKTKVEGSFYTEASNHYIRVFYKDKKKFVQVDHYPPQEFRMGNNEENFLLTHKVVKRLTKQTPIQVNRLSITISWQDEDGDTFTMTAQTRAMFEHNLEQFPRLKKLFERE